MLGARLFGRLSWRRFFLYGSAASMFLFFAFTLAPIVSPLPAYTGPHDVGVLDLEMEVPRRVVWDARLKDGGREAFELSTIAVTLYYPSTPLPPDAPQSLARPWLPQPISLIGTGYARMLGIYWPPLQALLTGALWFFGSSTVIPGVVDAPIIAQSDAVLVDEDAAIDDLKKIMNAAGSEVADEERLEVRSRSGVGKMPCVVFSHGMAGMSQSYSHYLGSIASHGVVVAAVEHRDGSGPGSIVHYSNRTEKEVWHVQLQDLESDPPMTLSDLKTAQLNYREAEIQETIRLFGRLNAGGGNDIVNLKPHSPEESLPTFENRLDLDAVTVAGHSYGATGILQALKSAHSEETPINGGIALDPGKASGPLNEDIDVPLLVMQSGEWTEKQVEFYGQGLHFDVVKKLVQNVKNGWFMTLPGTAHPSCTDAPLIVPWIMKLVLGTTLDPRVALGEYIDVSVEFLDFLRTGRKKGILKSNVTSPKGPLGDAEKRGKVMGKEGADWEVHVVPRE